MTEDKTDRTGGLLLALLIVVAALWVATLAYGAGWEWFCGPDAGPCEMGGCRSCDPARPGSLTGVAIWVAGVLTLLGGLWCAWRVASGRWSLRPRSARAS